MATPSEQLAKIKKGNAERSKKYYDDPENNKKIKERRRLERVRVRELKQRANQQPNEQPAAAPEAPEAPVAPEQEVRRSSRRRVVIVESPPAAEPPATVIIKVKRGKNTPAENNEEYKLLNNRQFSLAATGRVPDTSKEAVVKAMNDGVILPHAKKPITADMNIKARRKALAAYSNGINGVNILFKATNNQPLYTWLQKPEEFITKLPTVKKLDGEDFSKSQWQKTMGVLMTVIKYMKIPITEEQDIILNSAKNDFKMKYSVRKKTEANQIPAVRNYEKVLKFAEKDKDPLTYLVAKLYDSAPVRTDYHDIKIIKKLEDSVNEEGNFIILPEKGKASLLIKTHKTEKKHGDLNIEYPADTTAEIRKFVKSQKIMYGTPQKKVGILFGDLKNIIDKISRFACPQEKNAGANIIRRSVASTLYDKYIKDQASEQDILDQVKIMAHTYQTHLESYVYKIAK